MLYKNVELGGLNTRDLKCRLNIRTISVIINLRSDDVSIIKLCRILEHMPQSENRSYIINGFGIRLNVVVQRLVASFDRGDKMRRSKHFTNTASSSNILLLIWIFGTHLVRAGLSSGFPSETRSQPDLLVRSWLGARNASFFENRSSGCKRHCCTT
jgi:hypothetical protein